MTLAGDRRSLKSLHDLPWVGFDDDHTYMPGQRWLQEKLAGVRPAIRGNNWLVLLEAARTGAGFVILPCYLGDTDDRLQRNTRGRDPTARPAAVETTRVRRASITISGS